MWHVAMPVGPITLVFGPNRYGLDKTPLSTILSADKEIFYQVMADKSPQIQGMYVVPSGTPLISLRL